MTANIFKPTFSQLPIQIPRNILCLLQLAWQGLEDKILQYYTAMTRRLFQNNRPLLIINSDDYGCEQSIDRGILELLEDKSISSFSVLINQKHAEQGARLFNTFQQQIPELYYKTSVGLHFNLSRGPILSESMRSSCIAREGKFCKEAFLKLALKQGNLSERQIADEFTAQVKLFMALFKRRPSHVDSHNYPHLLPHISRVIAPIMAEFGIYRTRMATGETVECIFKEIQNSCSLIKEAAKIYMSYHIIAPNCFLGHLQSDFNADYIKKRFAQGPALGEQSIQLMCHPGYPSQEGSGWTAKQDRLKQMLLLQSKQFIEMRKQLGGLSSFLDLEIKSQSRVPRLLIYSKMESGTGNKTTALRLKQIFERIGYEVYFWSSQFDIDDEAQIQDFEKMLIGFGISLIVGINVSRSAKIIYKATFQQQKIRMQVPYLLVVAGTDANGIFTAKERYQAFRQSLSWCQCLISLSHDMTKITKQMLKELGIEKNIYTVVQSSCLSLELSVDKGANGWLPIEQKPFILFPTSFREIKCVHHILQQLNEAIERYNINVFIVGPIISQQYYEKVRPKLGSIQYLGVLGRQPYARYLHRAFAVINTSDSEGMSCSILEALEFKIPVIVRANSGNLELIQHRQNGLVYHDPHQFLSVFEDLFSEEGLRQKIVAKGSDTFLSKYSLTSEIENYEKIAKLEFKMKLFTYEGDSSFIKVYNQSFVHNTSSINNELFLQIHPNVQNGFHILDLGCGTGIFSLMLLLRSKNAHVSLCLTDIDCRILGNALYNYRQSSFWQDILVLTVVESNFLKDFQENIKFNMILFNPPQSPFRLPSSKPDKNGGPFAIKFYEPAFEYLQSIEGCSLFLLHSLMAWPSKMQQLLQRYHLKVVWESERRVHQIHKSDYDKMEGDLSSYIMEHWRNQRAEISLIGEVFQVPALIYQIKS